MNQSQRQFTSIVLSCLLVLVVFNPASAAVNAARKFPTPDAAAAAFVDAAEKFDESALVAILGPGGDEIIHSGEPGHDQEIAKQFAQQARAKMEITLDPQTKGRAFISIGTDDWPFPVPLVKTGTSWSFDSKTGLHEIMMRRIGRNELDAIEVARGFVEAQNEYTLTRHGDPPVNQYAQRIISTPGKQDGLAWQNPDGTWDGPVGENVAKAIQSGYSNSGQTQPYHGYFFKVLKGQGPDAPLGQLDYVVNGAMIGGFALIAFPAQYKVSGVKTFMVSNDGVVFEKDLGANTVELANKIERFNPDRTWSPVVESSN